MPEAHGPLFARVLTEPAERQHFDARVAAAPEIFERVAAARPSHGLKLPAQRSFR